MTSQIEVMAFHVIFFCTLESIALLSSLFRVTIRVILFDFRVQICIFDCKFAVSAFFAKRRKRLNYGVSANSAVLALVEMTGFEPTTFGL